MTGWRTFKEIEMDKVRTFPVINRRFNSVLNIDKIHPLKQKKVFDLATNIDSGLVKRVWIYGSSTNNSCNIRSDLDVLVELDDGSSADYEDSVCKINKQFSKLIGSDFDLTILGELDTKKQFYNNIIKTMRLIYERND